MITYAIRNKRTKKYVYGLDRRYFPVRKRLHSNKAMLFEDFETARLFFNGRCNCKFYEIVKLLCKCIEVIKHDNY